MPTSTATDWDVLWEPQVQSFFDVRTAVLRWDECDPATLACLLPEGSVRLPQDNDSLWMLRWQLMGGLLASKRMARPVPAYRASGLVPQKCFLLGSYEQMGPPELDRSRDFWEAFSRESLHGTRTRKRERLSAVGLVKRFAWPTFLQRELRREPQSLRYEDTATVAAAPWLAKEPRLDPVAVRQRHGQWSGQWLHWGRQNEEADEEEPAVPEEVWDLIDRKRRIERPPTYYAILVMDGDRMGEQMRGLPGRGGSRRQAKISRFLAHFALDTVSPIVEERGGVLIYAGGDDLLALLPSSSAIGQARRLADAFVLGWKEQVDREDEPATLSAGLAVVHYKEDLRFALRSARQAEKAAKAAGRKALSLTVCRRSGEHAQALCPWPFADVVTSWIRAFENGASDRWAYHLAAELSTLKGLGDRSPVEAEIRRQVDRADLDTRRQFDQGASAGAVIAGQFRDYCEALDGRGIDDSEALVDFVALCQSASFLARGRSNE